MKEITYELYNSTLAPALLLSTYEKMRDNRTPAFPRYFFDRATESFCSEYNGEDYN